MVLRPDADCSEQFTVHFKDSDTVMYRPIADDSSLISLLSKLVGACCHIYFLSVVHTHT